MEAEIGKRLSDLTKTSSFLLATDEAAHELLLVDPTSAKVIQQLKVNQYPVNVVATADGRHAYVASLWSRRLTFVELPEDADGKARVVGELDMPFAPRVQLLVKDDSRLVVADSYRGRLAVIDCETKELLHVREFPGHNIRGLGVSKDERMLLVSHQMLNELAHTVRNDVHWGLLMSNDLRWLNLQSVVDGAQDLYKGAHMHPIGEAGRGGGDPGGLSVAPDGMVVVTIAGTGEVSFGKENDFSLFRLGLDSYKPAKRVGRESGSEAAPDDPAEKKKGDDEDDDVNDYGLVRRAGMHRRPTAVTTSSDSRYAFVANTFHDSISIIDFRQHEVGGEISLGPVPELTMVDRGEMLFFDSRLSHDGWMSCNSCHTDGHTNTLLNDNFSDKSFGAPKRVLSLLDRAGTTPFAWRATSNSFEEQIRISITKTMQGDQPPTDRQVAAMAAFLEALPPPPPIDLARGHRDNEAVQRGRAVFKSQDCIECHAPPKYTTPDIYDVGLKDSQGNDKFNPPALIGVGQRGPYFHDGRADSLEDVFRQFGHKVSKDLSNQQLHDLVAFLRSL